MKEKPQPPAENNAPQIQFLPPQNMEDEGYLLRRGHSRKYRGNHRSETRGKGLIAFFRNCWMKSVGGGSNL